MRAGKITLGADMVISAMQKRTKTAPQLVLVSMSASDATRARMMKKCAFYETELLILPIYMEELGRMLGKTYAPAVISVNESGFANEIKRLYALAAAQGSESEEIIRKDVPLA